METKKKTFMDRFLNFVETVGNALPDPASLLLSSHLLPWFYRRSLEVWELLPFTLVRERPSKSSIL